MSSRIEAIAESLTKARVGPGSLVMVFQDTTVDWPCSMLAIMRVCAVYIPLDLRNPLARLAKIAASCRPAVILVDNSTGSRAVELNVTDARVVNTCDVGPEPASRVPNTARPESVAAILFTSGSTGVPKGVVVQHSGFCNEIEGYTTQ